MGSSFGIQDSPINLAAADSLGLGDYAAALADFVLRCQTPMTIALQGDWGSGKSSLMELIKEQIGEDCPTAMLNTWAFSQFEMSDELVTSVLSEFARVVGGNTPLAKKTQVELKKASGWKLAREIGIRAFRAAAVGAAGTVGLAEPAKELIGPQVAWNGSSEDPTESPAQVARVLREDFSTLVRERISSLRSQGSRADRVVIFVDDLDRIVPLRAVELLEAMKLFLDVPGCVFVLACDYQVIAQGLRQKFSVGDADLKGRSFFDKIIQLPFTMPISNYDVKRYFAALLSSNGIEHRDSDIVRYIELCKLSTGFNPRTMKRLFNSMLLLKLVSDRKQSFSSPSQEPGLERQAGAPDSVQAAREHERMRILFGCVCMQIAFPSLYAHLCGTPYLARDLNDLRTSDPESPKPSLSELFREWNKSGDSGLAERAIAFARAFWSAIQLESDQQGGQEVLSPEEAAVLSQVLRFSAVVDVGQSSSSAQIKNLGFGKEFRKELMRSLSRIASELGKRSEALLNADGRNNTSWGSSVGGSTECPVGVTHMTVGHRRFAVPEFKVKTAIASVTLVGSVRPGVVELGLRGDVTWYNATDYLTPGRAYSFILKYFGEKLASLGVDVSSGRRYTEAVEDLTFLKSNFDLLEVEWEDPTAEGIEQSCETDDESEDDEAMESEDDGSGDDESFRFSDNAVSATRDPNVLRERKSLWATRGVDIELWDRLARVLEFSKNGVNSYGRSVDFLPVALLESHQIESPDPESHIKVLRALMETWHQKLLSSLLDENGPKARKGRARRR